MAKKRKRSEGRYIRHRRVRRKLRGTSRVPRLSIFKSLNHIYTQVVDDSHGHTLVAVSSLTPAIREGIEKDGKGKIDIAKRVGKYMGELALKKGIKKVAFDRGGYPYHGRVKALAEGAREAGLEF